VTATASLGGIGSDSIAPRVLNPSELANDRRRRGGRILDHAMEFPRRRGDRDRARCRHQRAKLGRIDRADACIEEINHRCGVSAPAHTLSHAQAMSGTPISLSVGTSGMVTSGSSPVTATTFTFPALNSGTC
jgi:hypothetical protein